MDTIYWLLGYEEEIKADERQKQLRHVLHKQIKDTKKLKLKKTNRVRFEDDGFKPVERKKRSKTKKIICIV